jgi:hypothetical protein
VVGALAAAVLRRRDPRGRRRRVLIGCIPPGPDAFAFVVVLPRASTPAFRVLARRAPLRRVAPGPRRQTPGRSAHPSRAAGEPPRELRHDPGRERVGHVRHRAARPRRRRPTSAFHGPASARRPPSWSGQVLAHHAPERRGRPVLRVRVDRNAAMRSALAFQRVCARVRAAVLPVFAALSTSDRRSGCLAEQRRQLPARGLAVVRRDRVADVRLVLAAGRSEVRSVPAIRPRSRRSRDVSIRRARTTGRRISRRARPGRRRRALAVVCMVMWAWSDGVPGAAIAAT